jgi:glyoxylase-like metal-dependent hydrolase (beta-lactamase superfamily II)
LKRRGGAGKGRHSGDKAFGFYAEGDVIRAGGLEFKVLETPGHSRGSVTLMCENALFTGDTLFKDSCGRTDLEGGSHGTLMRSLSGCICSRATTRSIRPRGFHHARQGEALQLLHERRHGELSLPWIFTSGTMHINTP